MKQYFWERSGPNDFIVYETTGTNKVIVSWHTTKRGALAAINQLNKL